MSTRSYWLERGTRISLAPRWRSSSTTYDPRKPAPPVTTTRSAGQWMPSMTRQCTIAPAMRIVMSLLSLRPGLVGGAETYVRALLRHLPEVAGGDQLSLLVDRGLDRQLPAPGWSRVVLPVGARGLVLR